MQKVAKKSRQNMLPPVQQAVLDYIKEQKTAQVGELESQLKNYSRNTLKKDLAYLVKEGFLLKTGEGRGVRYHFIEK